MARLITPTKFEIRRIITVILEKIYDIRRLLFFNKKRLLDDSINFARQHVQLKREYSILSITQENDSFPTKKFRGKRKTPPYLM